MKVVKSVRMTITGLPGVWLPVWLSAWLAGWLLGGSIASAWAAPGAGSDARASAVVDTSDADAIIDWTRGMIVARGAAAADLRAPSPRVARVKATREAAQSARARLARRARGLPLAGSTVGALASADPAAEKRFKTAVERALRLSIDYASDGSVVLTAGLPLEAVRVAVSAAVEPLPVDSAPSPAEASAGSSRRASGTSPVTTVVLDARGLGLQPALGPALSTPAGVHVGPTVFHRTAAAALGDSRAGARVLWVSGARAESALTIDATRPAERRDVRADQGDGARSRGSGRATRPARADDAYPALRSGALLIVVLGPSP